MTSKHSDDCACGCAKTVHYETTEKVQFVDHRGQHSYEFLRAACKTQFCPCEKYEQR